MKQSRPTLMAAAVAAGLFAAPMAAFAADPMGVDDGTQLTLWTRAATQARAEQLIEAYNSSHKNHVTATYVVTDDYQTKIGAAAAAGGLPDLFSADVVFMPNWTSAGLFQDMTDRINNMPGIDKVAQAGINVATWEGKKYGMPFVADLSVWMWNKKLFKQAGLDPEKGPTTLAEFAADARAVAKLGNGVYGTFWGGNCGGCEVFTWFPIAWADGETVMNPEGTESHANSDEWKQIFKTFHDLAADGTAPMPDTKNETGATWTSYFTKGIVGIQPMPATLVGLTGDKLADADIGVTPIAGIKGGQSTFIGGDDIGISRDSKKADAAWNFIAWLQSDTAQVDVVAKNGNVLTRTDLANNKYSAADPRLVLFNQIAAKGQTPLSKNFGATFNDPQGPWVALMQDVVFGDASKLDADNSALNESLNP